MKLNLLPQTVSRGAALRSAVIVGVIMVLAAAFISVFAVVGSSKTLADAKSRADTAKQPAADALATSQSADTIIATAADVMRDASLAKAMIKHNDVYPELYDSLKPTIPAFFRINSESAQPIDAQTSRVILVGTVGSYEQYADLVLALMRFKDAVSISRTGYNLDDEWVPNLTQDDNKGMPRKLSQPPIPANQLDRLAYYQNQPRSAGYQGVSNFGTGAPDTKGAMPNTSLVTIVLTVRRDLRTPSVEATLTSSGGGGGLGGGGFGAPAGFGGPGASPFGPGGPTGPGGAPAAPGGRPGRSGQGAGSSAAAD